MPRTCTICTHAEREAIDRALVARQPLRNIALCFGTSPTALFRHKSDHLPRLLAQAERREVAAATTLQVQRATQEVAEAKQALDVIQQLKTINAVAMRTMANAHQSGDGDLALKAAAGVLRQLEFQSRLLGDLTDQPRVVLVSSPEWVAIRGALMAALAPFPEARIAVAEALRARSA
jgi:hypothetical protein